MGTRSLTVITDIWKNKEEKVKKEICVIYRQYDGYLNGHGMELYDKLKGMDIVNGLGIRDENKRVANGMSCLAAQVIKELKDAPGNIYLYPAGERNMGEEFIYYLYPENGKLMLKVTEGEVAFFGMPGTPEEEMKPIYEGLLDDFEAFLEKRDEGVENV